LVAGRKIAEKSDIAILFLVATSEYGVPANSDRLGSTGWAPSRAFSALECAGSTKAPGEYTRNVSEQPSEKRQYPPSDPDAHMPVDLNRVNRSSAMGATVWPDGTGFRTWAPNAKAVSVVAGSALGASGNSSWRPAPEDGLAPLGDGSWGGFLTGAGDGDPYMFFVKGAGSSGWKRDSYARELTISPAFPDSYCVVRDPKRYSWRAEAWLSPGFNDLVLYQLHVGTWWAQDETGRDVRVEREGTSRRR
jgi:hypothetical protein